MRIFTTNVPRGKAFGCKRLPFRPLRKLSGSYPVLLAIILATAAWNPPAQARPLAHGEGAAKNSPTALNDAELVSGFQLLYRLKFEEARQRFTQWEQERPAQPIGAALEAASDLFEEFYRKGVLTSEFFLDDKRLLGGIKGQPDAVLDRQFASAAQRAEKLARERLANQPNDPDALFALTLVEGMQADDLFLIQKRQLESLRHLREADRNARALLEVAPDADDAYVALGAANYIIGCLPGYKRAMLWIDGVHGDKALGMRQLSNAASSEQAHYLRPYARLMLALAALREKDPDLSRKQLQELVVEFPENPLFAAELAKITPVVTGASSQRIPLSLSNWLWQLRWLAGRAVERGESTAATLTTSQSMTVVIPRKFARMSFMRTNNEGSAFAFKHGARLLSGIPPKRETQRDSPALLDAFSSSSFPVNSAK